MKLWEVHDKIEMILAQCVDKETGEIDNEAAEQLDGLEIERRQLVLDIARYLKGERAEAAGIIDEAHKLLKRAKSHDSRAAWLEKYIELHVNLTENEVIKDSTVKVHWKKSTAVQLEWPNELDHAHVDERFIKEKVVRSIDKAKALPLLRDGERILGLVLEHRSKLKVD